MAAEIALRVAGGVASGRGFNEAAANGRGNLARHGSVGKRPWPLQ